MKMNSIFAICGIVALMTACSTPNNEEDKDDDRPTENYEFSQELTYDAEKAREFITGNTVLFFEPWGEYTDSITYFSPDGWFYDWFANDEEIYPGRWELRDDNGYVTLCLGYAEYDSADGLNWGCESMNYWSGYILERAAGDPFGLAHRKGVPFYMSTGDYDLDKLARFVRLPPFSIRKLDTAYSVEPEEEEEIVDEEDAQELFL